MSGPGDHDSSMFPPAPPPLDDATIDALVADRGVPPSAQHLAAFVADVRAAGDRAAPAPSERLATLLSGAVRPEAERSAAPTAVLPVAARHPAPRRRRSFAARLAGAGIAVKVAVGAAVATAGVVGATALDVVPGPAGDGLRKAVDTVTPLSLDDVETPPATDGPDAPSGERAPDGTRGEHGDRVSDDATGGSDGEPGVDGPSVADSAPGDERRPADAGPGDEDDEDDDPGEPGDAREHAPAGAPRADEGTGAPAADPSGAIARPAPTGR